MMKNSDIELFKYNKDILKEANNMSFNDAINIIKQVFKEEYVDDIKINAAIYVIGKNKLKELGLDYDIFYKEELDNNCIGLCNIKEKRIYLELNYWYGDIVDVDKIELLRVIFHEIGHAKQFEIDNYLPSFNYLIYYHCENEILRCNDKISYYSNNKYYLKPSEFIADTFAFKESNSFLIKHGIYRKDILKKITLKNLYFKEFNNRSKKIEGVLEKNSDNKIDEIMSNIEKRKYYLDKYPILKLKYNDDGTNNSLQEIINKIDKKLEKNPELLSEYANFLKVKYNRVIYDINKHTIYDISSEINDLFNKQNDLLNIKSSNEKLNKAINIYKNNLILGIKNKINNELEMYYNLNNIDLILRYTESIKSINLPEEYIKYKDILNNNNILKKIYK